MPILLVKEKENSNVQIETMTVKLYIDLGNSRMLEYKCIYEVVNRTLVDEKVLVSGDVVSILKCDYVIFMIDLFNKQD